jgi:hypothetical protein
MKGRPSLFSCQALSRCPAVWLHCPVRHQLWLSTAASRAGTPTLECAACRRAARRAPARARRAPAPCPPAPARPAAGPASRPAHRAGARCALVTTAPAGGARPRSPLAGTAFRACSHCFLALARCGRQPRPARPAMEERPPQPPAATLPACQQPHHPNVHVVPATRYPQFLPAKACPAPPCPTPRRASFDSPFESPGMRTRHC